MPSPQVLQAAVPEGGLSRYGRLARDWRARIVDGGWPAGAAIPPEAELARSAGVALGTARQALALLVAEGLLQRVHGRGTFVTRGIGDASMLRFFRFGSGTVPRSRIVGRREVAASAAQAGALGVGVGAPLLRLARLRQVDGRPLLAETLWLPLPAFAPLLALPLPDWDDLLYPMYSRRCGVTIARASDELSFGDADPAAVRRLGLAPGAACVRVDRQAFDLAGRCVELRTSFGDAREFRYRVDLR